MAAPPEAEAPTQPQDRAQPQHPLEAALSARARERSEHVTEDQILALETEAASPTESERWRAHLASCPACGNRARSLQRYTAHREVPAVPTPAPGARFARVTVLATAKDALLRLGEDEPRHEVVLGSPGSEVRLAARVETEGRIDVAVAATGVLVALHASTGRIAHAITGSDGRVTLPLMPGRSRLLVGTTPVWEIEIDL